MTPVQWLWDKLKKGEFINNPDELLEQALQIEEERMKRFAFDFYHFYSKKVNVPENLITENRMNVEEYYNETFKPE